jgi:hypothetical protein
MPQHVAAMPFTRQRQSTYVRVSPHPKKKKFKWGESNREQQPNWVGKTVNGWWLMAGSYPPSPFR